MTDIRTELTRLRRPRLLLEAARHGLPAYRRERDLGRLLDGAAPATAERALPRLLAEETQLEERRRAGDAGYSLTRHLELLIALLAEMRQLAPPQLA